MTFWTDQSSFDSVPVPDHVVDLWFAELRNTGSLLAACQKIGVSQEWYRYRRKRSPEFERRLIEARYHRPGKIMAKVLDGIEHGFPSEVISKEGDVVTIRRHCPKMTSMYMSHVHRWGRDQEESAETPPKQVQLITRDGQEVPLLDRLREGIEAERETTIAAPRSDVFDVEAIEVETPEADSGD